MLRLTLDSSIWAYDRFAVRAESAYGCTFFWRLGERMLRLGGCGDHSMQSILWDALLRIACGTPNKPKTGKKPGTKKTKFIKTIANKGIQG